MDEENFKDKETNIFMKMNDDCLKRPEKPEGSDYYKLYEDKEKQENFEFVFDLLRKNGKDRPTAEDALDNKWFKSQRANLIKELKEDPKNAEAFQRFVDFKTNQDKNEVVKESDETKFTYRI